VDVRLLTPWAALLVFAGLVPLAVYTVRRRRLRALERGLGLPSLALADQAVVVGAVVAVTALLGLAAAQPVLETTRRDPQRTDAEAFVVLDVSRSMLASAGPGEPTRFGRAREIARELRAAFPEVPFGIVTLTDRVLPHLFPTADERVFETTLSRALGVEKPPPGAFYLTFATNLNALRDLPTKGYFRPTARRRVAVVLTDGETQPIGGEIASAYERSPRTELLLVRLWRSDEGIYTTGVSEGYEPSPQSEAATSRLVGLVDGRVFDEGDVQGLLAATEAALGTGETLALAQRSGQIALMPWITALALVPFGLVLLRRNLWWSPRRRREGSAAAPERRALARPVALATRVLSLSKVK
jgi:hypothetical protein